jgi:phenylacetate-coenzyme A ligase PaaK-like adenylate-forming protein
MNKLLSFEPFDLPLEEKKHHFSLSIKEEILFHYQNNVLYRNYCRKRKFDPNLDSFENLADIPYIPVQVFKQIGATLSSVSQSQIKISLQSSATSGIPSTVLIDKETAKRQIRAVSKVLTSFIGGFRRPFYIMDLDPKKNSARSLDARGTAVLGMLNFASESRYFMSEDENGGLYLQKENIINTLNEINDKGPVVIFGFTYVLYASVASQLNSEGVHFKLPEGSKIIHIGGWKKLENQKVSKHKFNHDLSKLFGVSDLDIVDIYGFTEQMGVIYPDCPFGWKHLPAFSELLVRHQVTQEICPAGKSGLLQFITPLPHSYPGNSVLTDDVGIIDKIESCECGRVGTRFKILGRAKKAEVRGCGDIMADKITQPLFNVVDYSDNHKMEIKFPLMHSNESKIQTVDILSDQISQLKDAQDWLANQPVDMIIGLIDKVSKIWVNETPDLQEFQNKGLDFLAKWCDSTNLRKLADYSLRGQRGYLDSFRPFQNSTNRMLKATPRGLISHWLSGNVPLLGMLTIVQGIVTKNANIIKTASNYSNILPLILQAFEGSRFVSKGGFVIEGDDLLRSICVVYFDRYNRHGSETMSKEANVRIAWGGADAVSSVLSLPKAYSTEDIIFGPKISFMVIGKEMFEQDRKVKKLCRRAATDSSVFDQAACASPHTIFVEKGGMYSPKEFAEKLSQEMEKAVKRIPKNDFDETTFGKITNKHHLYDFIGHVWTSPSKDWSVLYDENLSLAEPTYSRVITVKPVDDIMDAIQFVSPDIQTIGLAIKGKRRLEFATKASRNGAERFPDIGLMTHFESPWDGVFVMERLIRWNTLGGP